MFSRKRSRGDDGASAASGVYARFVERLPDRRRRSTVDVLDDALLVVVAVGVGLVLLKVLGWIVGGVLFLIKVALIAAVAYVAIRFVSRRKD